jgi:hypothetical protein
VQAVAIRNWGGGFYSLKELKLEQKSSTREDKKDGDEDYWFPVLCIKSIN